MAARLHWLPTSLDHDGPTPVSEYFAPETTGSACNGLTVERAAFRGRRLLGATVPLPAGYAAYVLIPQPEAGADQLPPTVGDAVDADGLPLPPPPKSFPVAASFSSITYWKLDEHPAPTDGALRALEWVALADGLAKPVPAAAVDAALAAQSKVMSVE